MAIILSILAGAIWRWWDGTNGFVGTTHIRSRYRILLGFLVALLAITAAVGLTPWVLWAATFAMINMQTGYFWEWEEPTSTGGRFAIVGLITAAPFVWLGLLPVQSGLTYAASCALVGPIYYFGLKTSKWKGWFVGPADGFEWWARFVSGGIVIGGLSVL